MNYWAIPFNKKFNLNIGRVPYKKLNFTNISVSNAKKIDLKFNFLFSNIHIQQTHLTE